MEDSIKFMFCKNLTCKKLPVGKACKVFQPKEIVGGLVHCVCGCRQQSHACETRRSQFAVESDEEEIGETMPDSGILFANTPNGVLYAQQAAVMEAAKATKKDPPTSKSPTSKSPNSKSVVKSIAPKSGAKLTLPKANNGGGGWNMFSDSNMVVKKEGGTSSKCVSSGGSSKKRGEKSSERKVVLTMDSDDEFVVEEMSEDGDPIAHRMWPSPSATSASSSSSSASSSSSSASVGPLPLQIYQSQQTHLVSGRLEVVPQRTAVGHGPAHAHHGQVVVIFSTATEKSAHWEKPRSW